MLCHWFIVFWVGFYGFLAIVSMQYSGLWCLSGLVSVVPGFGSAGVGLWVLLFSSASMCVCCVVVQLLIVQGMLFSKLFWRQF